MNGDEAKKATNVRLIEPAICFDQAIASKKNCRR